MLMSTMSSNFSLFYRSHSRFSATFASYTGAALVLCLSLSASLAQAGSLLIQYTGLDIEYSGSTVVTSSSPDALTSVSITDDGVSVTGSPFGTDIDIALSIPGVTGLPVGGGSVISGPGGTLDLGLPGADGLSLLLEPATVGYINAGFVHFTFAGTVATISGQMLPDGLVLGDPVSVSFSAQVKAGTLDTVSGVVVGFEAAGTGELSGTAIPEPSTCLLGVLGILALGLSRSRQG